MGGSSSSADPVVLRLERRLQESRNKHTGQATFTEPLHAGAPLAPYGGTPLAGSGPGAFFTLLVAILAIGYVFWTAWKAERSAKTRNV
jgi:hypothetical protein